MPDPKKCPYCSEATSIVPADDKYIVSCENSACFVTGPKMSTPEAAVAAFDLMTVGEPKNYGKFKSLPREDLEPELHYRYRWASSTPYHPGEPETLAAFRTMLAGNPEKFYGMFAQQQERFDKIKAEEAAKKKPDEDSGEPCEVLVRRMLEDFDMVYKEEMARDAKES